MVLFLDSSCCAKGNPDNCFWNFYLKNEYIKLRIFVLPCISVTSKADCHKYYLDLLYKTCFKTLGYAEYGCLLSFKKMSCIRSVLCIENCLFYFTVCVWALCLEISQSWGLLLLEVLVKACLLNLSRNAGVLGAFERLVSGYFRRLT